jgi:hypothetical protein
LRQMNPVHSITPYFFKIRFIVSCHLHLLLPTARLPSYFSTKYYYAFLIFPIRSTCPGNAILLYLISLTSFTNVG